MEKKFSGFAVLKNKSTQKQNTNYNKVNKSIFESILVLRGDIKLITEEKKNHKNKLSSRMSYFHFYSSFADEQNPF